MNITANSQIVFVCRSEIEKTPKIVFPHEISVLEWLHGANRIEPTDAKSPLGAVELDLEVEFQRLLDEYHQADGHPHPVIEVYGDFDGFCDVVQGDKKPARRKKAE